MENPDDFLVQGLAYLAVLGPVLLIAGGLWLWRRPRLLPLPSLRSGLWTGRDVFLAYLIMVLMPSFIWMLLRGSNSLPDAKDAEDQLRRTLWILPSRVLPAILAANFFLMYWITSTRPADIGFSLTRFVPNAILGFLGFALATPFVLALHLALLRVWGTQPHPLEKLAINHALSVMEWGLLWFQVAVFAPVIEEWFFRGVLQGWLRRASPLGHGLFLAATFSVGAAPILNYATAESGKRGAQATPPGDSLESCLATLVFTAILGTIYGIAAARRWRPLLREGLDWFLPLESKSDRTRRDEAKDPSDDEDAPSDEEQEELAESRMEEIMRQPKWHAWQESLARLSVFGSAMLWASIHLTTWPAPIPLFLLGLLLGWMRLRTNNLWPGILLHSLFNNVAFASLVWGAMNKVP